MFILAFGAICVTVGYICGIHLPLTVEATLATVGILLVSLRLGGHGDNYIAKGVDLLILIAFIIGMMIGDIISYNMVGSSGLLGEMSFSEILHKIFVPSQ